MEQAVSTPQFILLFNELSDNFKIADMTAEK